jgi:transcription termination factor Rho
MGKKRRRVEDVEDSQVDVEVSTSSSSEIPAPGPRPGYRDEEYDVPASSRSYRAGRRSFGEDSDSGQEIPAPGPGPNSIPGPGPSVGNRGRRPATGRRRAAENEGDEASGSGAGRGGDGYGAGRGQRRPAESGDDYGRGGDAGRGTGRSQGYGRGAYGYDDTNEPVGDYDGGADYGNDYDSGARYGNNGPETGGRGNYRGRNQGGSQPRGNSGRVPGPGPGGAGPGQRGPGRNTGARMPQRGPGRTVGGSSRVTGRPGSTGRAPLPGPNPRNPRRNVTGRAGYRPMNQNPRGQESYYNEQDRFDDESTPLHEEVGMLEMHPNGYGFLRKTENNYSRERTDPFVPGTMIERFGLREGMMIRGMIRPGRGQTGPRVREILDVDGLDPEACLDIKPFDSLTPINPEEWYRLEIGGKPLTNRVIDLLAPMGKGQRALIVAPPRSGKTILLQHISQGIAQNYPDTKLIVLLVDERPEEVTDMRRNVIGEVVASSLDEEIESHVRLSQLVIERCKRLAEMGKDVFLLMDSITRLARAFNKWVGDSGRTMSGGVDIKAMDIPKKLFATARAFEEGGSVTIAGTALIDTDSRMDELIFQEFKGTGNMELVLDRKLAERRVWPAIDISKSGTRREELLLPERTLNAVTALRRTLTQMNPIEAMEQLTKQLGRFDSNAEFIHLISGKMTND